MSCSDESDAENMDCTAPSFRNEAKVPMENSFQTKSKEKYMKVYDAFMKWRKEAKTKSFSENVFLAYFSQAAKNEKPATTLWAMYSMLRCTIQLKHGINIEEYRTLNYCLKRQSNKSKKSKIFTVENIKKILNEAPDDRFLALKVALVLGINGACRCPELTNITVNDIEHHDNIILVKVRDTTTKINRTFVVRDDFLNIVQRYETLRPVDTNTDRFFLNYMNGKCTREPIGKRTVASMPKAIATFLKLPDIDSYTGHCFRMSSATLADSGSNLTTLKRVNDRRLDTIAEGYIEDSHESKIVISKKNNNTVQLKSSTATRPLSPQQSTSRQAEQNDRPQPVASQEDSLPPPSPLLSQVNTSQVPSTNLPSSQMQKNTSR